MGSTVRCRNVHAGRRQGRRPGPIISYCASPIPYIGPCPILVQHDYTISLSPRWEYKVGKPTMKYYLDLYLIGPTIFRISTSKSDLKFLLDFKRLFSKAVNCASLSISFAPEAKNTRKQQRRRDVKWKRRYVA